MTWGGYKCGEEITRWEATWGENKAILRKIIKKQLFRGWKNLESSKAIRDWMELADGKLGPVFLLFLFLLLLFLPLQLHLCNSQSKCSTVGWHKAAQLVLVIHQNKQLWGHPKAQGCLLQYECREAVGAAPADSPRLVTISWSPIEPSAPNYHLHPEWLLMPVWQGHDYASGEFVCVLEHEQAQVL